MIRVMNHRLKLGHVVAEEGCCGKDAHRICVNSREARAPCPSIASCPSSPSGLVFQRSQVFWKVVSC